MMRLLLVVCVLLVAVWADPVPLQGDNAKSNLLVPKSNAVDEESLQFAESANPEPQWGYGGGWGRGWGGGWGGGYGRGWGGGWGRGYGGGWGRGWGGGYGWG